MDSAGLGRPVKVVTGEGNVLSVADYDGGVTFVGRKES